MHCHFGFLVISKCSQIDHQEQPSHAYNSPFPPHFVFYEINMLLITLENKNYKNTVFTFFIFHLFLPVPWGAVSCLAP